jgi:hypothetical protein
VTLTAPSPAPPTAPRPRTRRWLAAYLGGVLAAVLPYAIGVLLPYFVNGLHRLPLTEVASGRYDPKLMWPSYSGCGGLVDLAGYLSLAWTPLALLGLAAVGPVAAWRTRRTPATALAFAVGTAACLVGLGWLMGPTSAALAVWRMD